MIDLIKKLKYSLHVIFHPFDGFWDIKFEKRANTLSAISILAILVLVFMLQQQLTGFDFNLDFRNQVNILTKIGLVLIPYFLWCISNWCIVSLVDGQGSFKDIFITTAYALVPLIITSIIMIIMSNFITLQEGYFYYLVGSIGYLWSGFLIFCGFLTIHQFSGLKTIVTILLAIVGMFIISFLSILFFALVQQMINFLILFFREISLRIL